MTVKELRDILKNFDDDVEVMTKKTEFFGNVGYVNSVKKMKVMAFSEFMCRVCYSQMNLSHGKAKIRVVIIANGTRLKNVNRSPVQ